MASGRFQSWLSEISGLAGTGSVNQPGLNVIDDLGVGSHERAEELT
jgi:hypothetical protein